MLRDARGGRQQGTYLGRLLKGSFAGSEEVNGDPRPTRRWSGRRRRGGFPLDRRVFIEDVLKLC